MLRFPWLLVALLRRILLRIQEGQYRGDEETFFQGCAWSFDDVLDKRIRCRTRRFKCAGNILISVGVTMPATSIKNLQRTN
ncbi:hypothetical protein BDR05DRAFT_557811 [Suillus weaverae]|nr:hypothetical protein BDR05DRAFT_557811 [Suillus weaverae]